MQFEDPQDRSTAYLILRHLYDGDVIEWPIAEDHPLRHVFAALEAQGYVARWDRVWPLRDRYRLTDQGIAAIEAVYRPASAEDVYNDVRGRKLGASQRRTYLVQRGYDPVLWPLLHDPMTRWDTWPYDRGGYHDWFWEDQLPHHHRDPGSPGYVRDPDVLDPDVHASSGRAAVPYVVDLDRDAVAGSAAGLGVASLDDDVS